MSKKEKNIWMFHHYASPPSVNGMDRPYDLGKYLFKYNYRPTIFAASFLHYAGKNVIENNDLYSIDTKKNIPFIFVKTRGYYGNGKDRVLNMLDYYRNLFKVAKNIIKNGQRPEAIIASSPHPLTMLAGVKIAKKLGIPSICEVRDFWPEVIFLSGRLSEKSIIGRLLLRMEHWIYKEADALIFLKEGDYNYLIDKRWSIERGGDVDLSKCHYINNGVDLDHFLTKATENKIQDKDLTTDKFTVTYTGSIRPVNDIGKIIDAAKLLVDHEDIQFLIYGEGNELEVLKKRVVEEKITNVKMKGYIDKKYIPFILNESSVNLLNYSQSQYNWSRGNSSNKLFEYMASGKPIISTVKMGYSIIEKYNCGIELKDGSPREISDAILYMKELPEEKYIKLGQNARDGAKDFDFKVLSDKLADVIKTTIDGYQH